MIQRFKWTFVSTLMLLVCVSFGIATLFGVGEGIAYKFWDFLFNIGQLVGLSWILVTLKYKEVLNHKFILLALVVGIFAFVDFFPYPYSKCLLMVSAAVLIVGSIRRFLTKEEKEVLSFLKLTWFVILVLGIVLDLNHYPGATEMLVASSFVLWIIAISYIYQLENEKKQNLPLR